MMLAGCGTMHLSVCNRVIKAAVLRHTAQMALIYTLSL